MIGYESDLIVKYRFIHVIRKIRAKILELVFAIRIHCLAFVAIVLIISMELIAKIISPFVNPILVYTMVSSHLN